LYPYAFNICIAIGTLLILFFNSKQLYNTALYCFIITLDAALIYSSNYYPRSVGTMVYFFPVIFCVSLLHNPNKSKYHLAIKMGIIFIGFLISQLIDIPFITPGAFNTEQLMILRYYNLYVSVLVTIVMVFLAVKQITKQYKDLNSLVKKLEANQVVISTSLKEKEILLAEIQHRVKNNLAVIIALFNFQKDSTESEETKTALNEAKNRVLSIAMVHEQLYKKDNLSQINLKKYISELVREVLRSHPTLANTVVKETLDDVNLDITRTIPVGLIINEIITNSLKHGFNNLKHTPEIRIQLFTKDNWVHISINDNGSGFPENIEKNKNSLGISLMESLTEQIDGKLELLNNNGAQVKLSLPV